jgi:hypothetical protein
VPSLRGSCIGLDRYSGPIEMAPRLPVVKRVCNWSDLTLKCEARSMVRQNESGVAEIAELVG